MTDSTIEAHFGTSDAFTRAVAEYPTLFAEVILSRERVVATVRVPGCRGVRREHPVRNGVPAEAVAMNCLEAAIAALVEGR